MFGISAAEFLLIFFVVFMVLGPRQIPYVLKKGRLLWHHFIAYRYKIRYQWSAVLEEIDLENVRDISQKLTRDIRKNLPDPPAEADSLKEDPKSRRPQRKR